MSGQMPAAMATAYGLPPLEGERVEPLITIPAMRPPAPEWVVGFDVCPVCKRHHVANVPCPFCSAKRGEGAKADTGKRRWSLMPMRALGIVVDVLTEGAAEYADWNWTKVPSARERYYDAMLRHVDAWWLGQREDPKSGKHPLAHAIASALFLLALDIGDTGPRPEEAPHG